MKNGRYVFVGILLMAVMAGSVFYIRKIRPMAPVTMETGGKTLGPSGAPVQIVVYSDFQCPACQKGELVIQKMMSLPEFSGKIHLTFRHYPLPVHRWAGLAHQAAECAHKEGKFWDYHHKLYAEQAIWSAQNNPTEAFLRYAKEIGLPLDAFALCLASPEIRSQVLKDQSKGDNLRIQSTPTYFINGERVVGPMELVQQGDPMIRNILGLPALVASSPSPAASAASLPSSPVLATPASPAPAV